MSYFQKWVCSFHYKSWISHPHEQINGWGSAGEDRAPPHLSSDVWGVFMQTLQGEIWPLHLLLFDRLGWSAVVLFCFWKFTLSEKEKVKSSYRLRGNLWQTWYIIQNAKIILIQICSRLKYVADLTTLWKWKKKMLVKI